MANEAPTERPACRSAALLDHLARRLRVRSEAVLAPLGLRPRHLVALTLLREHGAISQQALAPRLLLDSTNLVGLLNELEAQGLITRDRDPGDRRRHTVELTETGLATLARAEDALADAEDEVLGALDADEREQLVRLLRQAATIHPPADCAEAAASADPQISSRHG